MPGTTGPQRGSHSPGLGSSQVGGPQRATDLLFTRNMWVIPELIGHTIVTVLLLISLHWFIFLLNLPVATWNIYRYIMVPSGNMGVFDPTEIHNRGQLKSHMKEAMIKLGFHLLCFFMYLYSMILALIND
ncbi:protein cornichon homolog 4 isoform X3 [Symphalangus syndactylus]|uniref:protein cornichon homolog 4 isoform X3 n=1 Tax=Symphalangus syndactylus TaxID=9590 RepID=UPI003006F37F